MPTVGCGANRFKRGNVTRCDPVLKRLFGSKWTAASASLSHRLGALVQRDKHRHSAMRGKTRLKERSEVYELAR